MKKILTSAAAVLLILTSCSKNEVFDQTRTANNLVGFSVTADRQTRASGVTTTILKTDGNVFRVLGLLNGSVSWANLTTATGLPEVISETDVTYAGATTSWGTAGSYYWPDNASSLVSFFAVSQGNDKDASDLFGALTVGADGSSKADVTTEITVPNANADHKDVIASKVLDQHKNSSNGKVSFAFKHALSRVGFKAFTEVTDNTVKFKVSAITLTYTTDKIVNKGSYSFNAAATTAEATSPTYLSVTDDPILLVGGADVEFDGNDNSTSATAKQLNGTGSYLMIIPQDLQIETGIMTLTITYNVSFNGGTDYGPDNTKTVTLPGANFATGKAYSYNLKFTLGEISFDVTEVEEWTTVGTNPETDIDID